MRSTLKELAKGVKIPTHLIQDDKECGGIGGASGFEPTLSLGALLPRNGSDSYIFPVPAGVRDGMSCGRDDAHSWFMSDERGAGVDQWFEGGLKFMAKHGVKSQRRIRRPNWRSRDSWRTLRTMRPQVSLAVAQTRPARGDIDRNLAEHRRLAELAASLDASVIVFPELSLTGYELDLAGQVAFTENDRRLEPLLDAAVTHGLTLIAGAPLRIGSALHIAAFIVDERGGIAIYTKRRLGAFGESARCDGTLPPPEPSIFQPGTLDPVVMVDESVAAVAICADIGDPAHAERARARGASNYLASMFVIPSEFDGDVARLEGYAKRHLLAVAFANYGAPTGGMASAGRSTLWSEQGEMLVQLPRQGAGVAVATRLTTGWRTASSMLDGPN